MSLINDALKKAQRQRTNNPFGIDAPMPGGGGRPPRRGSSGMPTQTIILIVAGCAVLVVLSALGAVFFVNGKSSPKPTPVATQSTPVAPPAASTAPKADFPSLTIQPITVAIKSEPSPILPAANPAVETKVAPTPTASAVTAAAKSEPPAPKVAAPIAVLHATDERVHSYLDEVRVTAVRVAGTGSRVRLNEKVYRVNDIVDRTLNLKLVTVENDFLLFTDANGVEYRKNF